MSNRDAEKHTKATKTSNQRAAEPVRLFLSLRPEGVLRHDPGAEERGNYRDEDRGRNGRAVPVIAVEMRVRSTRSR